MPEIFKEMALEKYGLILVTGGTGTGKSTSLAALIDAINSQFAKHIVTLEDPMEPQVKPAKNIEPEFFPPGANVAFFFIFNEDLKQRASKFFQKKGFYLSTAEDVQEGIFKLRLNEYQLILLEDREEVSPLFGEINSWPGKKRRNVNCLLLGDKAPSMHQQEAFYRGVNFYLNINDKDRLDDLLEQALNSFVIYNEPWNMALVAEEDNGK